MWKIQTIWIISRTGVAVKDSDVICSFHRAKFGIEWRSSRLCCYPNHHAKSNSGLRALTLQEYHTLCEKFPTQTFPFGLQICTKHKKKLSNQTTSASIGSNPPEIHDKYSYDSVYVPEHFEATPESRKVLDELSSIFEKKTYEIPNIEACKHSPTKYIVLYKEKSKWNKGTVYQESYGACWSWSRRFFIKIIASRKRCCRWYSTRNQKPPWCVLC